jgi:alpha-beta hydrolase superfamily lysophospholipase
MWGCNSVFYYPDRKIRGTPDEHGLKFEDVHFTTADGVRLHGWFLPAEAAAKGVVLHVHGNAANITGHYEFVRWLPAASYHVLTFDYRGYGRSEGHVSREGTVEDGLAALDYLRSRPECRDLPLTVFGQSIGGSISTIVVARRKEHVAALVLDSSFTRYRDIVRYHVNRQPALFVIGWWFPWMIPEGLDCLDHIRGVAPVPVLNMHGKQDRIVPWKMATELHEAAGEPKQLWLTDDTDHMQVWDVHTEEAQQRFLEFVSPLRSR